MSNESRLRTRVAFGGRLFDFVVDRSDSPRTLHVNVKTDDDHEWTFEEPGWSPLSFGLGEGRFYSWSARRVLVFSSIGLESEFNTDEDLIGVFDLGWGWAVLCETSIRLIAEGREVNRLELSEVALGGRLNGTTLVVREFGGQQKMVVLSKAGVALPNESEW
jgi:hypothetical protein